MADPAVWTVGTPTRHVDADGSAVWVLVATDSASGDVYTTNVTLTAGREHATVIDLSDGAVPLSAFTAWSTS